MVSMKVQENQTFHVERASGESSLIWPLGGDKQPRTVTHLTFFNKDCVLDETKFWFLHANFMDLVSLTFFVLKLSL